jgi:large repetitive protein
VLMVGGSHSLGLYAPTPQGLTALASYPVAAPVSNILFGEFGDPGPDVAFLSGEQIQILRSSNMQLTTVVLPVSVRAFALGSFIFDRDGDSQIALVAPDGSVRIAARNEFDPRVYTVAEFQAIRRASISRQPAPAFVPAKSFPANGWKIVESFPGAAPLGANQTPLLFRTRVSSNGADDVMVLNAFSGQLTLISHPDLKPGAQTFFPGQVSLRPYSGSPIAALPMRINVDGRPGVVALDQGEVAPALLTPIPDPTFTVNTTSDGVHPGACAAATANECTLREAVLEANAETGTDTIMVPGGTYALTLGRTVTEPGIPPENAETGTLNINDSVNIIGAGQNTTIITWGTPTPAGATVDMVMSVNEDIQQITTASASISNLTIQNGVNNGSNGEDGDGGCMEFDTGTNGTATLTLTHVTLQNCSTTQGGGGGLVIFNSVAPAGGGGATISNSIIQGNSVVDVGQAGNGGGIAIAQDGHMTMTASTVQNNNATQNNSSGIGSGGGIIAFAPQNVAATTAETFIHSSTISGNKTAGFGGGINSGTDLSIDTGTVISDNAAGNDGTGTVAGQEGGGLYTNPPTAGQCPLSSTCTTTLSEVTITGNSATGNGGGISNGNATPGAGALTISFSRLAGNTTSGGSGSNLNNDGTTVTAAKTASSGTGQNWWGTNAPSGTINTINGGTTTFAPFIVLSNTASPNLLKAGQTSTVTASFLQDNEGNTLSASNLTVLVGLPTSGSIFSGTADHGTLSNVQTTIQSNGEATEIYTATSGGTDTLDAVIDNATVPATITVLSPPSITKAFSVTSIPVFTFSPVTATLTFTITNPNTANSLSGLAFTDNLPSGLAIADTTTPNTCGGTLSGATAGSTSISLSGGTINQNTTCTVAVDVKGTSDGVQNNTSGDVTATDAGGLTGNSATASITVINPPSITKSFAPTSITFGATSSLTLAVSSSNTNLTLNGVAFTDSLPAGVVVAAPSNLSNSCGGTASATGGSVNLSGTSLAPGASCTVSANVLSTTTGTFNNSVQVTSTNGGTGNTFVTSLTVTKANTSTTVTSSANSSVFGQSVTFTATVSPVAPGAGTPTGTVTFLDAGSPIGTGTLSGGVAAFATSALAVGSHTITTSYAGDSDFNGSAGSLTGNPQVVNTANTTTSVASSANPSVFGQSVTFTATVSAAAPGAGTPTGTVTFLDGGSPIGTGTLSGGVATFTTSALAVGSHTITTSYGVNGNFNGSTGALTGNPQVVNKAGSSTAVTSSQNPSTLGQPVTFTATVSAAAPGAGTPTQTVTFLDGGHSIGTATLSGGVASFTTSALSIGNHTITTNYLGDGNFSASTGTLTGNPQVVNGTTTTTTVTSSQGTITLGDTVTFTATVTANAGTPSGLVTFFDGNTPLGSGTLNVASPDQAIFTTALLSASGSPHSITAIYQGAGAFVPSTSSPISETVNQRTSSTGVSLNPITVDVGQSSTATVTLTDSGSAPPGTADTFIATGAPATGRTGFTSTLFADGLVLVAGGTDANNNVLNSAEIYSVSGAAFSTTGNLNTARTDAVAVLLPNGEVLVAGGSSNGLATGALNTAELFNPSTGTFSVAGSGSSNVMTAARFGATATLLNNGQVLIAGGENSGGVLNSAELYNPVTDTFTATGNLNVTRTGASATLLGTGKVLVAGGSGNGTANGALNSAEVFDPAGNGGAGTFTSVAGANSTLSAGRWQPEAALLLSGKVLIAGGQNSGGALTSADLYDPVANSFTASAHQMVQARADGSAVAMPNGMVLLAGGTTSQAVDLYDADSDRFDTTGSLQQSDAGLISTLLNNGDVLVVGLTTAATPASDAELYAPSFNPLGTVGLTSSEVTDAITGTCTLTPSTTTASACTSTVTPANVAISPHTITATYAADAIHSGSSAIASLTVFQDGTTTIVTANTPNPSAPGQSVSVSATVTPNLPGSGTPTGTVTVSDGVGQTCMITLSGGAGSCSLTPAAAGSDTITATYSGDANFTGSTSNGVLQIVNKAGTTTTVTANTPNPSAPGQAVTVSASVTANALGLGTPTGTVTVSDGVGQTCLITLSGGAGSCSLTPVAAGSDTITATYSGDANFTGSTSNGVLQIVNKASTTTAVTANTPNPSAPGQSVTVSASVTANALGLGTPTGTVTVSDGVGQTCLITLSGGAGSCSLTPVAAGSDTITATYSGDANFIGSTSNGVSQTVNKGNTTTVVTSSTNPSSAGQSVTFTAAVAVAAPASGTPTGSVSFLDGGSTIGTAPLSSGTGSFATSTLAPGNHTITASYGGNGNFNTSTGSLSQQVNQSYTITVSASPPSGGSVSGGGTFPAGSQQTVTAVANTGYTFDNWTSNGTVVSPAANYTFTLNSSVSLVANFGQHNAVQDFTEFPVATANGGPLYIVLGPDGALWFTENTASKIGRIDASGNITEFRTLTANAGPDGITNGPDGALWFTETTANKIGRITTAGAVSEYPLTTASSKPQSIVAGPDGALWFTESATNHVGRITPAGTVTNEFVVPTSASQPAGIVAGPDNALWFTEAAGNKIGRITLAGVVTKEYAVPTSSASPEQIVVGPDNNLWFTESAGNNIGTITTAGVITERQVPTASSMPLGITVGPDAALWFTENAGNNIGRITTVGVFSEFAITTAGSMPVGIAAGPTDTMWIAEFGANRIGRLASPLNAAILPTARSAQVGNTVTAFATIINSNATAGTNCGIAPISNLPLSFNYQTTSPANNALTGTINTPVNIPANGSQTFVIALAPSAIIAPTNVEFVFSCGNFLMAPVYTGIDTLLFSASLTPTPDIIALAATTQNDGIVHVVPPQNVFAVATDNLGSGDTITVATNTGGTTLPITVTVCQTNPATGACLQTPSSTVSTTIDTNNTPTFGIFVLASGTVPFDPVNNRIFVTFTDSTNTIRGETSVAVETQ